jgi:hypothetical protein
MVMGFERHDASKALSGVKYDLDEALALLLEMKPVPLPEEKKRTPSPVSSAAPISVPSLSEDERMAQALLRQFALEEEQRHAALRLAESSSMDLIKQLQGRGEQLKAHAVSGSAVSIASERKGGDACDTESEALARALQAMEEEEQLQRKYKRRRREWAGKQRCG